MGEARKPAGKVEILPPEKRKRVRRDGWTVRRKQQFLEAVARQATMEEAARGIGMSMTSVRNLRARDPVFDADLETALAVVRPSLIESAYQRAVVGVEEPVFQGGKLVGTRRKYSDSIMRLMLERGIDPTKVTPVAAPAKALPSGVPTQEEVDKALMKQLDLVARAMKRKARQAQLEWGEKMQAEGWAP